MKGVPNEHSVAQRSARGTFWSMVSNATGLLTGLFTAPLYVQYLGEAAYGSLLLISVIILYAELVDLGISGGCLRHTSAALRCGEVHRIPGLLGTAWLIQVAMASVGTVVLIGFSSWLMRSLLQIPDFLLAEVIFAFRLNAVSFWLNFVGSIPATVATAWGRFDIYGKVSAISLILKAIGGVGAAGLGFGLVGVGFVSLFVDSFVLGYNLWMANRFFSLFPWRLTWDKKSLRDILLFGRAITLTAVFQRVMAHWEKILLGRYVSASIVPYYSIPHSIPSRFSVLSGAIGGPLLPELSGLYARGDVDSFLKMAIRALRYVVVLSFPVAIFIVLLSKDLLFLWMGAAFAQRSALILIILTVGAFVQGIGYLGGVFLQAMSRPQVVTGMYVIQAVVYFPIAYWLVREGSVTGASLAWAGRATLEGILLLTAFLAAFSGAYRRLLRAWRASGIDWMLVWAILWGFFYHVILIELPLIFRLVIGGVIFWGGVLFIWYKRGFDEREIRLAVETAGLRRFLPFIQRWLNKQSPSSP